ncbi:MAG: CBS domain-containing protein [Gammaproteobacteria bacterium]
MENYDRLHISNEEMPELELKDEDILDAMRHIPGYLDISIEDFREIYHLAHTQAIKRLFQHVKAATLMLADIQPVYPDMHLHEAAQQLVSQKRKSLPVVDSDYHVVGMLTESDFLSRLGMDSSLQLLLKLDKDQNRFLHRSDETSVSEAMSTPVTTVVEQAGFWDVLHAFQRHEGRSMPVVDQEGTLKGLLLRKDFIKAHHLPDLL